MTTDHQLEKRYAGTYKRDGQECLFNIQAENIDEVWNFLAHAYPGMTISEVNAKEV
jgi:hypothetical protein